MHRRMRSRSIRSRHRGTILVLSCVMMVVMFSMIALAVDVGYLSLCRTELQRTADSAALAAAWELVDQGGLSGAPAMHHEIAAANAVAAQYAEANRVTNAPATLEPNWNNDDDGDCVVGTYSKSSGTVSTGNSATYDAIRVRVRKSSAQNGAVTLFFAPLLGRHQVEMEASATARLIRRSQGFTIRSDDYRLPILPITLDLDSWQEMLNNGGNDDWAWDSDQNQIYRGRDDIPEINLYPVGTGSPGNRGTVRIGTHNNSTARLSQQIQHGLSRRDLAMHGGELKLNSQGELRLGGNPGLSAAIQDELRSVAGLPRIIPLFRSVSGRGSNAEYVIVRFVGVRIMEVQLNGNNKRVVVQPCNVMTRGVIEAESSEASDFVYSFPHLVQ